MQNGSSSPSSSPTLVITKCLEALKNRPREELLDVINTLCAQLALKDELIKEKDERIRKHEEIIKKDEEIIKKDEEIIRLKEENIGHQSSIIGNKNNTIRILKEEVNRRREISL